MTHEKLVAGTSSPTRYTRIIRNPGAGTKYNRTYQQTDYVSRYTKTVAGGKDYVPPAPPEPDPGPLTLVTAPTLSGDAIVGATITATKAVYSGGVPPVEVQSQFQISDNGTGGWSGVDAWGTDEAGTHYIGPDDVGKFFRVAGRAVDSSEEGISKAETLMSFSELLGPVEAPEPEYEDPREATKAIYSDLNVYEVGEEMEAFSATWRDGNPDTQTYRSRWQTRATADDSWVNGAWTNHSNQQTKFTHELTELGQVRFQSQCRDASWDPVKQVNSFAAVKTITAADMVVEAPTLFGEPYVGETITCSRPNVTGGIPPYTYSYMWMDSNGKSNSNTATVLEYDVGKMMSCYVTVTDSLGTQEHAESNKIGPIGQYTIGDIQLENSNTGDTIENSDLEAIMKGASVTYVADYSGDLPEDHAVWEWKVRSGAVTIRGSANLPYCTFQLPSEYPGGCTLSVNIRGKADESYTDDNPTLIWNITYTE